ncbi:MAG: transposase [Actinomycetota bacterium]|nr:transposase [Actinomycetota bacterium]
MATFGTKMILKSRKSPLVEILTLNADVVSANVPDNKLYPKLTASLPKETKFITGDAGYDDNKLKEYEKKREKKLITPVEVKKHTKKERRKEAEFFNSKEERAIYKNRSITIEPFFGQIQEIFALSDKLPVKHLDRVKTLVLTCIFTFQCAVYFNIINDYSPMRVKHLIWSM